MKEKQYLRKMFIGSEDTSGSVIFFSLAFTLDGQMVVVRKKDYDQQYTTPDISEIEPKEFHKFNVDGVPLTRLVVEHLEKIIPKPN
jgi:hypothetical protein